MLNSITAAFLGILEGFTEFLPISSTAHLILFSTIMNISQNSAVKSFEIVIQVGAILAVVFLYWKDLVKTEIIKRLMVAFLPTGFLGFIFYKIIKSYFFGNAYIMLGAMFLGGLIMILFERNHSEAQDEGGSVTDLSYWKCFVLGIFQSISMIPGVSRSAATIIGGLWMKIKRKTMVEFSFLLAVPTMVAASGYDILKNLDTFSGADWKNLSVGLIFSFATAIVSIRFLLSYIRKHNFIGFGIYRMILAVVLGLFLLH